MKRLALLALLTALFLTGCGQGGTPVSGAEEILSQAEEILTEAEDVLPDLSGLQDIERLLPGGQGNAGQPPARTDDPPAPEPSTDGPSSPDTYTGSTSSPEPSTESAPSPEPYTDGTSAPELSTDSGPSPESYTGNTSASLAEDGAYDSRDDVALYLVTYGHLPGNYITKEAARELGWNGGGLEPYAPGKCIGGDRFGNREKLLPAGHTYTECDIDTLGASSRGAKRIIFSEDFSIYYTGDHYKSFELLYEGGTAP